MRQSRSAHSAFSLKKIYPQRLTKNFAAASIFCKSGILSLDSDREISILFKRVTRRGYVFYSIILRNHERLMLLMT
jgi:hypothetical protein